MSNEHTWTVAEINEALKGDNLIPEHRQALEKLAKVEGLDSMPYEEQNEKFREFVEEYTEG